MSSNIDEMGEPIYDVADECEKLFEAQIARFNRADDGNGAALISELSHQFSTWANSMRVFADGDLSLDRKLQGHVELQDQVLRGLDLMQANLAYAHKRDVSSEREEAGSESPDQPLRLSIENVEAVSEALKRLQEIGMVIRHSSAASQARRAREHTEALDLSSFTQLASLALKLLFSAASVDILEQLTISMTDTYRTFLYRRNKTESQPTRRTSQLPTIQEDPVDEGTPGENVGNSGPSNVMAAGAVPASREFQAHVPPPQSRPTTIDSREAFSRLGKVQRPPIRRGAASILVSHVDYPKPAEGSNTCEWCFSPLPRDTFQGDKWQQHVNEDHRPFVCISEKCMKSPSLPRFSTSTKWLQHMLDAHGLEWYREVHAPSQWVCPLCHDTTIKLSSPEALMKHLDDDHSKAAIKNPQKSTIVRQSRASHPRRRNECPLCCLSIEGEQDAMRKRQDKNKRNSSNQAVESEIEKKRFKTQTGHSARTLQVGESDAEVSSSQTLPPDVIARHIAGHLRTIMLLTLRIISIDGPVDVSTDQQSISGKTDDQLSRLMSSHVDLGERSDLSVASSNNEEETDEDYQLEETQAAVPHHGEITTWDHVRTEEVAPMDDFLHSAVEQGAFQSHLDESSTPAKARWTDSLTGAFNGLVAFAADKIGGGNVESSPGTQTVLGEGETRYAAWRSFEKLSGHKLDLSLRALQWVLCSYEPLDTEDLSMAMLIDPDSDQIDELNGEARQLLRGGGISDLCGSLITWDGQQGAWRFKDSSTSEYFTANYCGANQAFAFVAMACLKFLTTDPCAAKMTRCWCTTTPYINSKHDRQSLYLCSFIRPHAIRYVQEAEKGPTCHDTRLEVLEKRFLGSPHSSSAAYRTWAERYGSMALGGEDHLQPVSSSIIAMAAFGLRRLLSDWWMDSQTDLYFCNDDGISLLDLADERMRDAIEHFMTGGVATHPANEGDFSRVPAPGRHIPEGVESRFASTSDKSRSSSTKSRPRHSSQRLINKSKQQRRKHLANPFSFLFVVNKLLLVEPELDQYLHYIPGRSPDRYTGELPSRVLRYLDGEVSEAIGYHWYRECVNEKGYLIRQDAAGNFIRDPSTDELLVAQQYKAFAVFACNPLLPIMVAPQDPLAGPTDAWELLRIFHPRDHRGLSQVVTLESPIGDGGEPVRHVAGRSPTWIPGLLPKTYRNPWPNRPESRGLGGELPIILGLMALTADRDPHSNEAVNGAFLTERHWRRGQWRNQVPRGYPDTAQDDPNGFLCAVFLDPESPASTAEALHRFEWEGAIVHEG